MFNTNFQESILEDSVQDRELKQEINFSVEKTHLVKALSHVQSVVEKRNIIPILSNVKLVVKEGKLELTTTDMDISVSEKITAYILNEGAITLPAHTLYDIIRKLPDDSNILFKINERFKGKIDIIANDSFFSLPFLSADDFPMMDKGIMPFKFSLTSEELRLIIDRNKFSISSEETRYNLNGIFLHIVEKDNIHALRAVATDGHRLSCTSFTIPKNAEKLPAVIIPKKAAIELRKIIDSKEVLVDVEVSNTKIKFNFDGIELISKLIDGIFPEYEELIPKDINYFMEISKKSFVTSVDRVSTITFEKTKAIKFKINNGNVEFSVSNDEIGEAQELVECKSDVDSFEIGFNSKYLLDVASAIDGDTIRFEFTDSFSPAKIHDKADQSSIFVIMPMRI